MFAEIDKKQQQLKDRYTWVHVAFASHCVLSVYCRFDIIEWSITQSSLEEVFMRIVAEVDRQSGDEEDQQPLIAREFFVCNWFCSFVLACLSCL